VIGGIILAVRCLFWLAVAALVLDLLWNYG
jgi:hypothetical protein